MGKKQRLCHIGDLSRDSRDSSCLYELLQRYRNLRTILQSFFTAASSKGKTYRGEWNSLCNNTCKEIEKKQLLSLKVVSPAKMLDTYM